MLRQSLAACFLHLSLPCSAGEEVTISYGPWPNEVLLQQWGFVPEFNPYDAVALFDDFEDLLCQIAACNTGTGVLEGAQSIS